MNDWASYSLQNFIPFTENVYFRLMERMGETFWPLHLLTLALGAGAVALVLKHRPRIACLLIAPVWAFVAVAFFMQRYGQLNWAGDYIGYAFLAQAALLVLISLPGRGLGKSLHWKSPPVVAGEALVAFGLVVQPLLAPLAGDSWYQAQVFGVHPDPTAIVSLGVILLGLRSPAMWVAAVIPLLWILISALTLLALDAPGATVLFAVLVIGVLGLIGTACYNVAFLKRSNEGE
ncbi:MAG: DUF6064 family protein [Pseudomonadota bacterium]